MPLDATNLQIAITAKDLTGGAFAGLQRSLARSEQSMGRLSQSTEKFSAFVGKLQGLAAALGVSLGVSSFVQFNRHLVEMFGSLKDLAEQLGLTTDQLQAYQTLALTSGISQQQFESSLIKFNGTLGEARKGNKEAVEAFRDLGVAINGLSKDEALQAVAARISELGSVEAKNAALQELFGRSGARMITIMEDLAKGSDFLIAKQKALGLVVDQELIRKFDEATTRGQVLQRQFEATFARDITLPFIQAMNQILELINKHVRAWGDARKAIIDLLLSIPGGATILGRQLGQEAAKGQGGRAGEALGNLAGTAIGEGPGSKPKTGTGFPMIKGDADKAADAMQRLKDEAAQFKQQLELLSADTTTPWPEFERQIESMLRVQKQADDFNRTMKIDAKNPLAVQFMDQAIQTEKARLAAENYKRTIVDADQFERRYGNGMLELTETMKRLNDARDQGRLSQEAYTAAVIAAQDAQQRQALQMQGLRDQGWGGLVAGMRLAALEWERNNSTFAQGQRFFENVMRGMEDALTQFVTTGKIKFRELATSIIGDLIRIQLRAATTSLFGGGGLGSLISGLFGGGGSVGGFAGGLAAFAEGGRPAVGQVSIVGERGPELFVPDTAGTILPNGTAGGGGVTVVHNITVNGGDERGVERAIMRLRPMLKQDALDAVLNARARGGSFAQAFRA